MLMNLRKGRPLLSTIARSSSFEGGDSTIGVVVWLIRWLSSHFSAFLHVLQLAYWYTMMRGVGMAVFIPDARSGVRGREFSKFARNLMSAYVGEYPSSHDIGFCA